MTTTTLAPTDGDTELSSGASTTISNNMTDAPFTGTTTMPPQGPSTGTTTMPPQGPEEDMFLPEDSAPSYRAFSGAVTLLMLAMAIVV